MALVNIHFLNLQQNYLFADIAKKVNAFKVMHPKADVISLGIGDVTQPLAPAEEQGRVLLSLHLRRALPQRLCRQECTVRGQLSLLYRHCFGVGCRL